MRIVYMVLALAVAPLGAHAQGMPEWSRMVAYAAPAIGVCAQTLGQGPAQVINLQSLGSSRFRTTLVRKDGTQVSCVSGAQTQTLFSSQALPNVVTPLQQTHLLISNGGDVVLDNPKCWIVQPAHTQNGQLLGHFMIRKAC